MTDELAKERAMTDRPGTLTAGVETFTMVRDDVLEMLDDDMTPQMLALWLVLRKHARNNAENRAWPGRDALAEAMGVSARTITTWVSALQDIGMVTVRSHYRSDGSQAANSYYVRLAPPEKIRSTPPENSTSTLGAETFQPREGESEEGESVEVQAHGHSPPAPDRESDGWITDGMLAPHTLGSIQRAVNGTVREHTADELFAEWWGRYPRKVAKDRARKAYGRVLDKKRATPEQLLTGVEVLVDEVTVHGTEQQFIPHPTTWLNGGQWADERTTPDRGKVKADARSRPAIDDWSDGRSFFDR